MAQNYVVNFEGKDNISATVKNIGKELENTGKKASEIDKIEEKFNKLEKSNGTLKGKLAETKKMLAQLNQAGEDNSPLYQRMARAAGEYKDSIADADAIVKTMSSDHLVLQTGVEAMQALAGAASLAAGAYTLFGGSEEDAAKITKNLMAIQSTMNGIQTLANTLNSRGALIQGIKALQAKAATAATVAETTATKGATIAQRAFNVAAKANPYVLLATAVIAVGAALIAFASNAEEANEELEEFKDNVKEGTTVLENMNAVEKNTHKDVAKTATQIQILSNIVHDNTAKLKDRKTALDILKSAVKDYHGSLTKEGELINDNTDALDKYIDNLVKAAAAQQIVSQLGELYNKKADLQTEYLNQGARYNKAAQEEAAAQAEMDRLKPNLNSATSIYQGNYGIKSNDRMAYDNAKEKRDKAAAEKRDAQQKQQIIKGSISNIDESEKALKDRGKNLTSEINKSIANSINGNGGGKNNKPDKKKITTGLEIPDEKKKEISTGLAWYDEQIKKWEDKKKNATNMFEKDFAQGKIDSLTKQRQEFEFQLYPEKGAENVVQQFIKKMQDELHNNPLQLPIIIDEEAVKRAQKATKMADTMKDIGKWGGYAGEQLNTLGQAFSNISDKGPAAKAGAILAAIGSIVSAFASALASDVSTKTNIWAFIAAAVASTATLTGLVAQMQRFEHGGIVQGSSTHGDNIMVRANAGEMILSRRQQSNLFNMLNNGAGMGNKVEFEIKGSTLVGALNNYNRKMSKL